MTAHIDDDAALYALGALEEVDRIRIDEHVKTCAECSQRLGEAEVAVADIEEGRAVRASSMFGAARSRRSMQSSVLAIAAAVALAILSGFAFVQNISLHRTIATTDTALAVLASSHFNHVSFVPASADAPVAKAIYGRHGEWIYIIANTRQPDLAVYGVDSSGKRLLGRLRPGGAVQTLFMNGPGRLQALQLERYGRILSRATPAYSK